MPTSPLQEKFTKTLENSKSFQAMNLEAQLKIKKSFANATDEQHVRALEILKNDAAQTTKLDEQEKIHSQKLTEAHEKLKASVREMEKQELKEGKEQDAKESAQAADKLVAGLAAPTKKSHKLRKFLEIILLLVLLAGVGILAAKQLKLF